MAGRAGTAFARARRHLVLAPILALSAFLQFYRLGDWQHFQGDEGLLALAARQLIVAHQLPVYGLLLNVGHAHIGPLFDYMIALPLWLSGQDPTGATAMVGAFQVLAVGLLYALCLRAGAGRVAGAAAALVFATGQMIVYYSRFMWPNMLPCFVLLLFCSALSLCEGHRRHAALMGIWLAVALQLQPTALLLPVFLLLNWLLFRPPVRRLRYPLLGALAMIILFLPSIVHDVTHRFVELRAWIDYVHYGRGTRSRALAPTLQRLGVLLPRVVGLHDRGRALILLGALALSTAARAVRPAGTPAAILARLTCLYLIVYMGGYLAFGPDLRPHYTMPLFPIPALAIGLLAAPWSRPAPTAFSPVPNSAAPPRASTVDGHDAQAPGDAPGGGPLRGLATALRAGRVGTRPGASAEVALRAAAVLLAVVLAAVNVRQTWQAGFLPDRYQISLEPHRSNRITLGQMRAVRDDILAEAAGQPFTLSLIAQDDAPFAYQALLLARGGHLSMQPTALLFLVIQPPDLPREQWPAWSKALVVCPGTPHRIFAAAQIWTVRRPGGCAGLPGPVEPAVAESPPR